MCYVVPFTELAVSHTSVLTILAITVERYYAICLPLQAGIVCTKTKATLTCIVSWVFGFLVTLPTLIWTSFTKGNDESGDVCVTDATKATAKFYFIFIIVLFFLVPLIILVVMYNMIAAHLAPPKPVPSSGTTAGSASSPNPGGGQRREQHHENASGDRVSFFSSSLHFHNDRAFTFQRSLS